MKPGIPWSVKGIDAETRDAAKEAARRAGMTLGEWLNAVILDQSDEDHPPQPAVARRRMGDAPPAGRRPGRRADRTGRSEMGRPEMGRSEMEDRLEKSRRQAQRPDRERAGDCGRPLHGRPAAGGPQCRSGGAHHSRPARPPRAAHKRHDRGDPEPHRRAWPRADRACRRGGTARRPGRAGPCRARAGAPQHRRSPRGQRAAQSRCAARHPAQAQRAEPARRRRRADGRAGAGRARVRGCSISPPA